jgi:hypothetical protein
MTRRSRRRLPTTGTSRPLLPLTLLLLAASCASVEFDRETQTSGTFTSTGLSLTVLSLDIPKASLLIARENVSDAAQANTIIDDEFVFPHFGPLDWILDIFSIRYARVTGRWGVREGETPGS